MASGSRSAKRRKLSTPDDDASAAISTTENTPSAPTPAKSTLKRPTRRAGLISTEGSRTSSRLARRHGHAPDLDDPGIYDDFDSAFGGSPARQLQSESATAAKRAPPPKKTTRAKPKAAPQSDSQKENIPEDSEQEVKDEAPPKPVRRGRNAPVPTGSAALGPDKEEAGESRSSRARAAGKKQETPIKKTRTPKKAPENGREGQDDEPQTAKKAASKAKTPAKLRASATKPTEEKASLLDFAENGEKASEDDADDFTPDPIVPPVSKRRNQSAKSQSTSKKATGPSGADTGPSLDALTSLKAKVLGQITGKESVPLVGLEEEYKKVHQLVEQTISAGEGNSMLMIGARGSGKTALVNQVLNELSRDQRQDFHIIRLNGFVHTDDKLALREIWRQLGKEMDVEEDAAGKNYADTLAKLLALLSHPSELAGEESDEVAKAVIFVMDEFDLFASHPRQTLLYNLFDIAQSRKAPITVLGLTTRIGVSENLEKRVKSRFSHRYVHLSLAKSFTSFQDMCKSNLMLRPETFAESEVTTSVGHTPSKSQNGAKGKQTAHSTNILTAWNSSIRSLFADEHFLHTYLAPHYHLHKSVPAALSTFHLPISLLSPSTFPLTPAHFATPTPTTTTSPTLLAPPDSKLSLLAHLSDLALALLVAAARLDIIHDADTCNFNMAYAEYASLASRAKIASAAGGALASGTRVWGREAARREWENLSRWELVMPVVNGGGSGGGIGGGSADSVMVRCDVALEEIAPSVGPGLDRVVEKWCRHI
ncbi:origin recognition complex subunit [Diplodia corticola]|uniref:Origin recognition complex subunit 4 n=1 Tax=Diplodia corticola TaxID=236234 RepID=A0A1J9RXK9_9PEZI|nr:origin recognition complex subunit [Diplodia corticola]OJD37387.1 origin recognition complex subunit [Diplodia corticola]